MHNIYTHFNDSYFTLLYHILYQTLQTIPHIILTIYESEQQPTHSLNYVNNVCPRLADNLELRGGGSKQLGNICFKREWWLSRLVLCHGNTVGITEKLAKVPEKEKKEKEDRRRKRRQDKTRQVKRMCTYTSASISIVVFVMVSYVCHGAMWKQLTAWCLMSHCLSEEDSTLRSTTHSQLTTSPFLPPFLPHISSLPTHQVTCWPAPWSIS